MNIKLVKEVTEPLLSRKVLNLEVDYPGSKTPSKEDIRKAVAALQKVKDEHVIVKHVYPKFGNCKAEIIANIYNTVQDLKKYELKTKKEKKKAEKPVEKKEEKPKKENANA